jgi:hypothetical protein
MLFTEGSSRPFSAPPLTSIVDLPGHSHLPLRPILDAITGVVPPDGLTYLATPINGGSEASRSSPSSSTASPFVEANVARARQLAARIRSESGEYVFDSTCFSVHLDWTQDDYIEVCLAILRAFARRVVFADGWEYSRGCISEYLLALSLSRPCLTASLEPITYHDGIAALGTALESNPGSAVAHVQRAALAQLETDLAS